MTEAEWLASNAPEPMLEFLHRRSISDRKYRLFTCACCRRIWYLLDGPSQQLLEVVERYLDGLAHDGAMATAAARQQDALQWPAITPAQIAACIVATIRPNSGAGWALAWNTVSESRRAMRLHSLQADVYGECAVQATILREIIGNPFRMSRIDLAALRWNDETVPRLARVIADKATFGDLPILADALEEAGCTDADILNHCRQPREHARGCWVIDLLLRKS